MRIIPTVACLALVASTFEAMIFLPSHFADWGGAVKGENEGPIGRLRGVFKEGITLLLRHRLKTLLVTLLLFIAAVVMLGQIKQDLFAEEEWSQFYIDITLPTGTPREVTNDVTAKFEEELLPLIGSGEIVSLSTTVGFLMSQEDWITQSNVAQITVDVSERKEGRERPIRLIMEEFKKITDAIPGAESVNYRMINTGPPVDNDISFRITGDNYSDMASIAADYRTMLEEYPELYNIEDNFKASVPELGIVISEERAAELGLSVAQAGMYIRSCFEGVKATTFFDEDEEIDVIVKLAAEYRESINDILQMKFPTPDGRLIPFSTICTLSRGSGISKVLRTDRKREITVTADATDKGNLKAINERVEQMFTERYEKAYPEISLKMGGMFQEFNVVLLDILQLFWIGIFLIYVILGAQFKSFIQPVIILATVPIAFVGCIFFLFVSGTPISVIVLFAVVALAGISVNDSIVLISFINGLRRKGMTSSAAIIEGAVTRLRPIILTSVTTIGGLIPMAVGLGGYSDTWGPMASTIIFGIFFSTLGTLIVIPCLYSYVADISKKFGAEMKLEGE
jgi:multidrug efflux pump subunit AcrB